MESSVEESKKTRSLLLMSSRKETCLGRVESLSLLGLKFGTILMSHPQNPMKPKHQTPLQNEKHSGFREDTSLLRLASGRGLSRKIILWGHTFLRMGRGVRSLSPGHVCTVDAKMLEHTHPDIQRSMSERVQVPILALCSKVGTF